MARPKGVLEISSGFVRSEVWKRLESYLNQHPNLTFDELKSLCLPIALKTMPEKLEGEGLANVFNVIVKSFEGLKNSDSNRLLQKQLDG